MKSANLVILNKNLGSSLLSEGLHVKSPSSSAYFYSKSRSHIALSALPCFYRCSIFLCGFKWTISWSVLSMNTLLHITLTYKRFKSSLWVFSVSGLSQSAHSCLHLPLCVWGKANFSSVYECKILKARRKPSKQLIEGSTQFSLVTPQIKK